MTRVSKDQESMILQKPEGRGGRGVQCPRKVCRAKEAPLTKQRVFQVTWTKKEKQFNG